MVRTNTYFGKYRYKIHTSRHNVSEIDDKIGKVIYKYSNTENEIQNEKDPRIKQLLEKINSSKDQYEIIALSSELIGIRPKNFYGYLHKAISYHKLKQNEKSEQSFKEAIKKANNSAEVYLSYSGYLIDLDRFDEALECLDKITSSSKGLQAWHNKGVIFNARKEYQKAIECYDRALELDENSKQTLSNKGVNLTELKEHQKAIECFDRALELDENDIHALNNKAEMFDKLGKYPDSITYYKKSLSIKDNSEVRTKITDIIKKQNSLEKENTATKSEDNGENPKWTNDPPTEKQLQYIEKLGGDRNAPKTKGEASEMITKLLSQKK